MSAESKYDHDKTRAALNQIIADTVKMSAETAKFHAENAKYNAETSKVNAEILKIGREHWWYPVTVLAAIITATVLASVAFTKLFL